MRQYICDYCKNPYEKIIKPKDEPRKETTTEEGHLAIREIIGCIVIVALIIAGICGIVYICKANPEKPELSEPTITKQSIIKEPISTPAPIIESEPTGINESKTASDEIIFPLVIHIYSEYSIYTCILDRIYIIYNIITTVREVNIMWFRFILAFIIAYWITYRKE